MDQIYHLACPASPPHYQYNPIKTIKTSTQGTINMLGLARRVKARLLLTSTSEVCRFFTIVLPLFFEVFMQFGVLFESYDTKSTQLLLGLW